ncbi:hypothetical protein J6590_029739 [Homalodisca vitripennis]|nr:hypothetical protein J6590_029739 [Homalodisca vitripennis]
MTEEELDHLFGCRPEEEVPDYEIVPLPSNNPRLQHFNFTVFGKPISLDLKPNELLVSRLQVIVTDEGSSMQLGTPVTNCHYISSADNIAAAFSSCNPHGLNGWIFLEDDTLEVRPLTPRLHSLLNHRPESPLIPYLVKRTPLINMHFSDELYLPEDVVMEETEDDSMDNGNVSGFILDRSTRSGKKPVVEVALFFDEAGYKIFSPYLQNDEKQLRDMLLAYLNGVQALYHHPSVGQPVDIALVRLEIFKSQPQDLPHYGGERSGLLDSFCAYNAKHNPPGDQNPEHWDMGLYVSGLDFYAIEGGRRSDVTMGLATVGGVCMDKYSCVIAELGTTNSLGKPYPSAGFTSVYILAHEMGHNLGMHHDSSSNMCPSEGYIMSPSRGTNGETLWSSCSAQVMQKLR